MKGVALCLLLISCLLLAGCGQQSAPPKEAAATAAPTPALIEAPAVTAPGPLGDAVRQLFVPYQEELARVAQARPGVFTYTIPQDLMNHFAQDGQSAAAQPQEGRYRFTWQRKGQHTYSASAMQVKEIGAARTPDPQGTADPVMDNQQMGDFSATGGGVYVRTGVYDVDEGLKEGTAELTDTLNDAVTGHELYAFSVQDGCYYFVDAMLDQAVGMDGLEATDRYQVAAGVLRQDGLEIIEFTVPDRSRVPGASASEWQQLKKTVSPLTRLTAEGDRVTATP